MIKINQDLHLCLIDYPNAFATVSHVAMIKCSPILKLMENTICPLNISDEHHL